MARDTEEEIFSINLRRELKQSMTENEQLFATYYNRGKILVKDMDDTQLREHIISLRQIATEAKATLLAADDENRERVAKRTSKGKEWLLTVDDSQSASDLINVVEKRKARMSKMDKLREQLLNANIDEATVNEMVKNLERKATDQKLKTVTFKKPSTEDSAIQVKPKPEISAEPFDPTKLFGKKD